MKLGILVLVTSILVTNALGETDEFDGIKCGSDIPKALIGKRFSHGKVVQTEKRHADLGLKDLGGDETSDRLFSSWWLICGSEYLLLQDRSIIRDVLKIPPHSKTSPEFYGSMCEINGKKSNDLVVAILDNEKETDAKMLPAKVAWKLDEKKMKFVSIPVEGLRCSRDNGVLGEDSGR
ncbi:MAG TPA: hypothetical protein VJ281_07155 [Chthoniobacterales bacterium]|jgi:hypothetical protein|nr:hypothetical protein [Chthoniobacterales bacterium]